MSNAQTKIVWIVGAASGVGLHMVGAFIKRGWNVAACDINFAGLMDFSKRWPSEQLLLCKLNVCEPADWDVVRAQIITRWNKIDVFLNTAAILRPGILAENSDADINQHVDINIKGTMFGSRAAAKQMIQQQSGHIINFASLAGIAPIPGIGLYSATKFAVRGYSLVLAQELREHHVAVTVLCPDAIQTPMLDLQVEYPEAAFTFSGGHILTVDEIEQLIFSKVLTKKPFELVVPEGRGRMAKLSGLMPNVSSLIAVPLKRVGERKQKKIKEKAQL